MSFADGTSSDSQQKTRYADKTAVVLSDELKHWFATELDSIGIAQDPFQVAGARARLGDTGTVHTGMILFTVPYLNCYAVAVAGGGSVVPCYTNEILASPEPMGPRSVGVYPPGTSVLLLLFGSGEKHGIIMGAIPSMMADGNIKMDDYVVQGSGAGFKREKYYETYVNLDDEGGLDDFSNHRPADQTIFDWGMQTETGLGIHLDPFLAFLRVDETCGVFLHYIDQHMVLAGYSMDWLTAAHTEQYRDDEGELSYYRGEAVYTHEALGTFTFGHTAYRENSDEDTQYDRPVGKLEPASDEQLPFHRYEEYGGYVGQGRIRSLSLPPEQPPPQWQLSSTLVSPGVFREQISLDGEYVLSSARGITLVKRSLIPIPKRIKAENDYGETADSSVNDNYRHSGLHGGGPEHAVGSPVLEGEDTDLLAGASVLDSHAYTFGWKNVHVFHYHTGDFAVPDEAALPPGTNQATLDFNAMAEAMWMPRPDPTSLDVDPRYGKVDYYAAMSMLKLLPDGTVVLQGGYGEEIRFERGNIRLSCPGHVMLEPGKSLVALAGNDVVIRANHSVDLTANRNDIRVKAEKNLHMLSGNGGVGGTLLENRSVGFNQDYAAQGEDIKSAGIMFKVPESLFGVVAGEIYLGTGAVGSSGQPTSGDIVLDAARGKNNIRMHASSISRFLRGRGASDIFLQGDQISSITESRPGSFLVDGQFGATGSALIGGSGLFGRDVQVATGHFASQVGGPVGRLRSPGLIRAQIENIATRLDTAGGEALTDFSVALDDKYYQPGKVGNEDQQILISFGMRTDEQYGTTDFRLPVNHWQTLAEGFGSGGSAWAENPIKYQNAVAQMPWPGKAKWQDEETLLTLPVESFNQYDLVNGREKPRFEQDSTWTSPKLGPFVKKKPQEGYKVIT